MNTLFLNAFQRNSKSTAIHAHLAVIICFLIILPCHNTIAATHDVENDATALTPKPNDPKYPIEIEVDNQSIKDMLHEYLPILYYQRKEELDAEQISYLVEGTPQNALDMLKTEGYFNAKVTIASQDKGYLIKVDLGPRTHIDNVSVSLLGDILQDENLGDYYKNAFYNWALPVGSPFRQEDWSSSKVSVLSAVTRKKYPLAQFSLTEASINPKTDKAELTISVNSNRPIYFGELQIHGQQRYPISVIQGLAQFSAGDVYDLDKILDYQQALEQDSHYSGASVQADFSQIENDRVPIVVSVSEVKRHKLEAGLGFDSEYGLGGNMGYDYYNLFNRGYTGSVFVEADKYQSTLAIGISQPRNSRGHYLTSNISYTRSTTQKLETHALSSGIWRVRNRNNIESRYGIEFIGEKSSIPEQNINLGRSYATMLTVSWKRQNIETTMRPANGYYLYGKIGTTLGQLLSSSMIVRLHSNAGYYFTPENKKLGTLVLRGELGYVYSNANLLGGDIPSSLMFRTGGATSIRGYELDSIGRHIPNSTVVLPEQAMAVASIEYQLPIKKDFSLAMFHDVGSVAHRFQDMKAYQGTGLGLRWFSPFAPFSFDIAYGHQDKKFRWHINLGTRF